MQGRNQGCPRRSPPVPTRQRSGAAPDLLRTRLDPRPAPANVTGVQPGGGWAVRVERGWGRPRRAWLRTFRPAYVTRMRAMRRGDCPGCSHDVLDPRDLKFCGNVCGHHFAPQDDRFAWRGRLPVARWGWAELLLYGGGASLLAVALLFVFPWAAPLPALAAVFVVAFFRHPPRTIPAAPRA